MLVGMALGGGGGARPAAASSPAHVPARPANSGGARSPALDRRVAYVAARGSGYGATLARPAGGGRDARCPLNAGPQPGANACLAAWWFGRDAVVVAVPLRPAPCFRRPCMGAAPSSPRDPTVFSR